MVKLAVFGGGSIGGFVGAANLRWLEAAFARARKQGFRGVMLFMQANPRFEDKRRNGFSDTLTALERETLQFAGQVGLVHGDSHYFRIDKPLVVEGSRVANFTRLETFGPPDAHWIRAAADPRDPVVFQFEQRIVAANVFRLELPERPAGELGNHSYFGYWKLCAVRRFDPRIGCADPAKVAE